MGSADQYAIELRNRIYHFAIRACEEKRFPFTDERLVAAAGGPPAVHLRRIKRTRSLPTPADATDWSVLHRDFLGLTQTCQQLRKEFLPLYRGTVCISVGLCDIPQYFDEHVKTGVEHDCDARANVAISLWDEEFGIVDLRDVILYASKAPGIKLRLVSSKMEEPSLKLDTSSAWLDFLSNSVSRLEFVMEGLDVDPSCSSMDIDKIVIYVKRDHAEDWMPVARPKPAGVRFYLDAVRKWMRNLKDEKSPDFGDWAAKKDLVGSWMYALCVDRPED